jgi:hypothetical protein
VGFDPTDAGVRYLPPLPSCRFDVNGLTCLSCNQAMRVRFLQPALRANGAHATLRGAKGSSASSVQRSSEANSCPDYVVLDQRSTASDAWG